MSPPPQMVREASSVSVSPNLLFSGALIIIVASKRPKLEKPRVETTKMNKDRKQSSGIAPPLSSQADSITIPSNQPTEAVAPSVDVEMSDGELDEFAKDLDDELEEKEEVIVEDDNDEEMDEDILALELEGELDKEESQSISPTETQISTPVLSTGSTSFDEDDDDDEDMEEVDYLDESVKSVDSLFGTVEAVVEAANPVQVPKDVVIHSVAGAKAVALTSAVPAPVSKAADPPSAASAPVSKAVAPPSTTSAPASKTVALPPPAPPATVAKVLVLPLTTVTKEVVPPLAATANAVVSSAAKLASPLPHVKPVSKKASVESLEDGEIGNESVEKGPDALPKHERVVKGLHFKKVERGEATANARSITKDSKASAGSLNPRPPPFSTGSRFDDQLRSNTSKISMSSRAGQPSLGQPPATPQPLGLPKAHPSLPLRPAFALGVARPVAPSSSVSSAASRPLSATPQRQHIKEARASTVPYPTSPPKARNFIMSKPVEKKKRKNTKAAAAAAAASTSSSRPPVSAGRTTNSGRPSGGFIDPPSISSSRPSLSTARPAVNREGLFQAAPPSATRRVRQGLDLPPPVKRLEMNKGKIEVYDGRKFTPVPSTSGQRTVSHQRPSTSNSNPQRLTEVPRQAESAPATAAPASSSSVSQAMPPQNFTPRQAEVVPDTTVTSESVTPSTSSAITAPQPAPAPSTSKKTFSIKQWKDRKQAQKNETAS